MDSRAIGEQVQTEFECQHLDKRLCVYHKSNGTTELREQCTVCGAMVRAVKKDTVPFAQHTRLPTWDDTLSTQYWAKRHERYRQLHDEQRNQKNQQWWAWYNQYLVSPQWQVKRRAVLDRCKGVCEGCGVNRATEAHHLTYEHVGHELLFELVGLCHDCHQRADDKQAAA
jgi:5-methylcytosine-specific restriction endonuclease McrA